MTKTPKTNPKMLVYKATPGPWQSVTSYTDGGGRLIIESPDFRAIAATSLRGAPSTQSRLSPDSPYYRSSKLAVVEANALLLAAAPQLLVVAQKLLLWLEECIPWCDFRFEFVQDEDSLYHELRQAIIDAGGLLGTSEKNV